MFFFENGKNDAERQKNIKKKKKKKEDIVCVCV